MKRRKSFHGDTAPPDRVTFLAACLVSGVALAGPYSTGLSNINPNAIDPGVPGFVAEGVNPVFVGWATGFSSYLPAPNINAIDAPWRDPNAALGPVTGDNFSIVSLGDLATEQIAAGAQPGRITLSFKSGIRNIGGTDFVVFENSLGDSDIVFAELAHVEVSSDGVNFAKFPSISLTPEQVGPYGSIDPTDVHNLPGKHINAYGNSYGTPFDLGELTSDSKVIAGQVNLNAIKYVRLTDIPGNGSFTDSAGHPIYDAWPTFGSGGFDLEAIGVTHAWLGGDANLDGAVNREDLGALARHWQQSGAEFSDGDFTGDGIVDIQDLRILAKNWNILGDPVQAFAEMIPEPASLTVLAVLPLLARRRKHSI